MKSNWLTRGFGLQKWITPVVKQSFVTTGVALNLLAMGVILGFAVSLLEQLKAPGADIPINDDEGSWLAAVPSFFAFGGTVLVIPIMEKYGRRTANLISIILLILAWIGIVFSSHIAVLIIARALQGFNMGMACTLGPLFVGEYTSPIHRGAFLMTLSLSVGIGVLFSHIVAVLVNWRMGALICSIIALIDLIIVWLSPESPSWLASQGKYDECTKAFRWLRGDVEEEELNKIITACIFTRRSCIQSETTETKFTKLKNTLYNFIVTLKKKEFYKPVIICGHVYIVSVWCGAKIFNAFPHEFIRQTSGKDVNLPLITASFDVNRIITSTIATYLIKKFKRRTMLFATVFMNIAVMVFIAVYCYAKETYISLDHPIIGTVLSHLFMITIAAGPLPLSFTIAGEVLPLAHKSLAGGMTSLILSLHMFLAFKFTLLCFTRFGVHGTFCIYTLILCYGVAVVWFMLPETKDRMLQDIEEEFRGKPLEQTVMH